MNLTQDPWIPAIRADGRQCRIVPWQIAETDNPVVELAAPRADFQGALYQFLIGLLQTTMAPEDSEHWSDLYHEPPSANELASALAVFAPAFELFSEPGKPAFLQDLALQEGEAKGIAGLLIDAPGGKTVKDNLDFFIKSGQVEHLCPSCVAQALFTLQTNAPSGGVGHRVGLRGGGPLTTLLRPAGASTLWQKLWLNVLDGSNGLQSTNTALNADVFPWLAATRVSDKTGKATFPEDVAPLQMYWGMPRRIRLQHQLGLCHCSICGGQAESCVSHFITRNYGTNYDGAWLHPLTPYRIDPKKEQLPLSLKGQKGGMNYRHWLGLVLKDNENGDQAAKVVRDFLATKSALMDTTQPLQLWCFGYDMDNMKARCWYEHTLPVMQLGASQAELVQQWAQVLVNCARESAQLLRQHIKQAWYRRPKDVGGDMTFIDAAFYQATTGDLYKALAALARHSQNDTSPPQALYEDWFHTLKRTLETQFDQSALNATPEAMDLKRVMLARASLFKGFHANKHIKQIKPAKRSAKETA